MIASPGVVLAAQADANPAVRHVMLARHAGIAYHLCMQYTIRGVPGAVDEAIRRRARAEGKSLNEVTVEALALGLGLGRERLIRRDLSDVAGSWKPDKAFDAAVAAQDRIDPGLWE